MSSFDPAHDYDSNHKCATQNPTPLANASSLPPPAADPKAHATACSSSRSCVKSHPVCVKDGLLWVYGDSSNSSGSSSGGQQQQQQLEPPVSVLIPEGYNMQSPWFQRDGERNTCCWGVACGL